MTAATANGQQEAPAPPRGVYNEFAALMASIEERLREIERRRGQLATEALRAE